MEPNEDTASRKGQETAASAETGPHTMLTFRLQGEIFALSVAHVSEVIDPLPTTPVPRAGALVPGLVNVRGSVVPVMSLRHRLGTTETDNTAESRMIVLTAQIGGEAVVLAVTADSVERVMEIEIAEIEPVPEIGIGWPAECLSGVAKSEGDLVLILDPEVVFDAARQRDAA